MQSDTHTAIQGVFFDLDGTLVDTAPDLHLSLAEALEHFGLQCPGLDEVRLQVSHGTRAILEAGCRDLADLKALERLFIARYQANICRHSHLFPGMAEVLDKLEQARIPWGIVTNKPAFLTQPLCAGLGLAERTASILSGDSLPWAKPHPAPILHACREAGVAPQDSLYIGDAQRDIQAGRAAGSYTLVAGYGYLSPDDRPEDWQADGSINEPLELLAWL
jgi:phosphoglycolate phosphatase